MIRPLLHLTPPHGYLGDPNGLVERDGLLHAYYQWTPDAVAFGRMHWGHAVSRDLVTWEHRGAALIPGDALDVDGCWSGCAATTPDGEPVFLYTAAAEGRQRPRLAVPTDGTLDVLVPAPGVLAEPPAEGIEDFRDPFVWDGDDGRRMALVSVLPGRGPAVLTYAEHGDGWRLEAIADRSVLVGVPGRVWECASVLPLGDRWVVVLSVVEGDGADAELSVWAVTLDRPPGPGATALWSGRLDLGQRFYAALPWRSADGRWTVLGWIRTQDDEAGAIDGWTGCLSLPRELVLDGDRVRLVPAAGLRESVRWLPWVGASVVSGDSEVPAADEASAVAGEASAVAAVAGEAPVCAEIVVETGPDGILRLGGAGEDDPELVVPVGALVDERTTVRVVFDAGVVEAFGPLCAYSATRLALPAIASVHADGGALVISQHVLAPTSRADT